MTLSERKENFINKSNVIHKNLYNYGDDYHNIITKVKITCPNHGIFEQTPRMHLKGQGCPKCGIIKGLSLKILELKSLLEGVPLNIKIFMIIPNQFI